MISHSTIQAIKDIPMDAAFAKYLPDLKRAGATWKAKSPFNDEKSASFYIHETRGFWKDFSSGKGGSNIISYVMQKEGIEFVDAIKLLAQDFNITVEYDNTTDSLAWKEAIEKKKALVPVLEWAFAEFQKNEIPKDFLKRFPETVCHQFAIGYCTGLLGEAVKTGFNAAQLYEAGLLNKNPERDEYFEKFADRVMFTIYDWRGQLVGFSGRVNGEAKKGTPKYLHSAFEKSKQLFGISLAKKAMEEKENVYVVEGPTDCMRFHQMNIANTVAKQGSDFSDDQAKLIKRFCGTVTFVPDNDSDKVKNAGLISLERNAETALKAGLSVKVLIPGGEKETKIKK